MERLIDNFNGNFEFLSNFSPHKFRGSDGILWLTVEHFYQAMKAVDMVDRGVIWSASTPGKAKRLGRTVKLREDWDKVKIDFMKYGVECKFNQNNDIAKKLMSLERFKLVEGNNWHDNFWGDCRCKKCESIEVQNHLGKILMNLIVEFWSL